MREKWFTVDLRCGTCGAIFCATRKPVREHKVVEYVDMFLAKGPTRFIRCKNRCPITSQDPLKPQDPALLGNQNQKIVTAEFFPKEHGF